MTILFFPQGELLGGSTGSITNVISKKTNPTDVTVGSNFTNAISKITTSSAVTVGSNITTEITVT